MLARIRNSAKQIVVVSVQSTNDNRRLARVQYIVADFVACQSRYDIFAETFWMALLPKILGSYPSLAARGERCGLVARGIFIIHLCAVASKAWWSVFISSTLFQGLTTATPLL